MAMTSKEKKEYIALGVIFGLMILVLGYYFLGNKPSAPAPVISAPGSTPAVSSTMPGGAPTASSSGSLLPNGDNLNLQPLNDPRFTSLVQPTYPQVQTSEVGSANPFLTQQ